MKCLSCGKKWQLDGLERFCPYCGKSLHSEIQSVECPVCGTTSQVNSLCGSCGFDFSSCMEIYDTFTLPLKTIRSIAAGRHRNEIEIPEYSAPEDTYTADPETQHVHDWAAPEAVTTQCSICGISRHRMSAIKFSNLMANCWDVQKIQFLRMDMKKVPEFATDLSVAVDRSILAWVEEDTLTVATDGVVAVSDKTKRMFCSLEEVQSIQFNKCIDTSEMTNMRRMFYGCRNLKQLDLSDFDISNVTDMSDMFQGCRSLTMDGLICTDSRIRSEYSRHH